MTYQTPLTPYQRAVLDRIHDAPWCDPSCQTAEVQAAIRDLQRLGYLQTSCLKKGSVETTEKAERLLNATLERI